MDRQLSKLLSASSTLFNPLQRIGVRRMGELVNANSKHFITSVDLERIYGAQVKAREKRALKQICATITGVLPPVRVPSGVKSIGTLRNKDSLDLCVRDLPSHLAQV